MAELPPLRALQAFEAVGRCGNMTKASRELNVSPGAVSQQIRLLEEKLGLQLVVRSTTSLALTDIGKRYYRTITKGFEEFRRAQAEIERARWSSGLVISALPSLASKWLATLIFEWQHSFPDLSVHLEGTHLEPRLEEDCTDFRITYGDRVRNYDSSVMLFTDSVIPVCSPKLLESGPPLKTPADLLAYPLLSIDWQPQFPSPPTWQDWLKQLGVGCNGLRHSFVFSLSSVAIEAAVEGRGFTLGQCAMIAEDLRAGRLAAPFPQKLRLSSPYFLAWNGPVFNKNGAREFHRWIVGRARRQELLNELVGKQDQ
ncbi:LysR substrate-binding domain-containing protein [Microvirga sp. TS319]|uniref:LysR substrate-binding domain-containing protein n=1 Tax=Microvirga sp. TS319 TaxID=3241165 RepID=UPI00351AA92B